MARGQPSCVRLETWDGLLIAGNTHDALSYLLRWDTSLEYRGVHAWHGLSADARDYSLEKFKKYVAGTVFYSCNYPCNFTFLSFGF